MDPDLPELEQEFRQNWSDYNPAAYSIFLERVQEDSRCELLVRMLSAELEFYFQPPTQVIQRVGSSPQPTAGEDERVRPCVQLFTLRFPELLQNQANILRLIVLEYALRLRYDPIPPNPDSYIELVPDLSQRLSSLLELTESKIHGVRAMPVEEVRERNDSTVRESEPTSSISMAPFPFNLGCFLLVRHIARGGMGYVLAAIDLRSTAQVAVKVMKRIDAWSVYRFIEEFSWLSQLSHPNLVRLYDAFSDGDVRYFSMELVEGRTIRDWFRRLSITNDGRWVSLRKVLAQLASAIQFLHQRGVIHRDVKCSNVMITPRRRAVLLDLGLVMRHNEPSVAPHTADGERIIGTLQYMAPEGLKGGALTFASDWYSFGVIMYEVMVDSYPPLQVNPDVSDPVEKYSIDEEQLLACLAHAPRDLADLCISLLQPDPLKRPAGNAILRALGHSSQGETQSEQIEILGREEELLQLNERLEGIAKQTSSLIALRGVSGLGKTTLLQQWIGQVDRDKYLVFSLRCFRQDHTPLRLLNILVQALVHSLNSLPDEVWRSALNQDARLIGRTFPQIQQLVPEVSIRDVTQLDPTNASARRDTSLRSLLSFLTLLSQYKPMVIVVDDAHWADADSLKTLCQLLSSESGFTGALVVSDLNNPHGVVTRVVETFDIRNQYLIHLEPLTDGVCQQLLRKWALTAGTRLSPAVQVDLTSRSEGNPFLLQELFRAFQNAAREVGFTEELWLGAATQETRLKRFSALPDQAEVSLQYLAVADQPIGFHQMQMVSRITPHELQRTLSYLSAQGWIRNRGENLDSEVEIANETFRRLVIDSVPAERLERRHFRMARVLSSETPPPWSRVAHHYWNADKKREAAACYMEAARVAAGACVFDEALYFLDRAFTKEAIRTSEEQFAARKLKANCLAGMGSSVDAAKLYETLRLETADPQEATLIECLAGEQWIRAGQLDKGLSLLRGALSELGFAHAKRNWWMLLRLRWRTVVADFRGRARTSETTSLPSFSLLEQCLTRVSTPLTFLDNQLGPELILRLDEIATRRGSAFDQAQVLVRSGIILSFVGRAWRQQALRRLKVGRSLARGTKVASSQATAYFCMYVWSIQRGLHRKARKYAEKALSLYEHGKESAQWEMQFLHWGTLASYWNSNLLRDLQQSTARLRASAKNRADSMSLFWMNVSAAVWSDLSESKVDQARLALEIAGQVIANQSFQSPRFYLWHSRILLAVYEQDWRRAQELITHDWNKLAKSLVLRTKYSLWQALSARICADLVSHYHDPKSTAGLESRWLRDARRCVKQMLALEDRVFVCIAKAFALVVDAAAGKIADQESWEGRIEELRKVNHHLLALALQWHQSLHAPNSAEMQSQTEQLMRDAGCIHPQQLLNIVLPLPPERWKH